MAREYKDITLNFGSLAEFSRHIAAGKTQPIFQVYYGDNFPSNRNDKKVVEKAGTNNFEEADRLLKYGDKKSFELLKKNGFEADAKNYNFGQRRKITPAVVGFAPIVPNAIAGVPVAMQQTKMQQAKTKVVNVVLSVAYDWSIDKEDYSRYAAKVLNGCLSLEKKGVRINLFAFIGVKKEGQRLAAIVKIKDSKTALDPLAVAYPVINSSFLRRHIFRLIEREEGLKDEFVTTYGTPLDTLTEITECLPKALQGNNVIVTSYYHRSRLQEAFAGVK